MRIPRLPARPWVAVAAVVAAAAILLTVIHQGNANADTSPPDTPGNPLAHLIVPDGEEPHIRVSWDAPDAEVSDYTITRADGQTFSANGAATTFSDHTVEPGTTYAYSVAAHSADGASPASESASADVPGHALGARQPHRSRSRTRVHRRNRHRQPDLAGIHGASTPTSATRPTQLTGYTVVRSDGDQETELGTADAGATSFIDNTAAFSRQYTYRVMARNAIGASSSRNRGNRILATRAATHRTDRLDNRSLRRQRLAVVERSNRRCGNHRLLGTPVPGTRSLRRNRRTRKPSTSRPPRLTSWTPPLSLESPTPTSSSRAVRSTSACRPTSSPSRLPPHRPA